MAYLIGTDEAGYGPNLGPLVVAATVWEVPRNTQVADLIDLLGEGIATQPQRGEVARRAKVVIGDSKRLYQSGKGLQHLEAGLWPALACLETVPQSWQEIWQLLAPGAAIDGTVPWFAGYNAAVPVDARADELGALAGSFRQTLENAGVRLAAVRCRAMFPQQFNRLLSQCDSKGTILSQLTLGLVAELIEPLPAGSIRILCDKHGGRNRYQGLLEEVFPDCFIEVCGESGARSVYRFGPPQRRVEFCFAAHGETYLPAALASMAAKYLRELAMRAWNEFWMRQVPGLKATAGYPQDAPRFKGAIAGVQQQLGIEDAVIWRVK